MMSCMTFSWTPVLGRSNTILDIEYWKNCDIYIKTLFFFRFLVFTPPPLHWLYDIMLESQSVFYHLMFTKGLCWPQWLACFTLQLCCFGLGNQVAVI